MATDASGKTEKSEPKDEKLEATKIENQIEQRSEDSDEYVLAEGPEIDLDPGEEEHLSSDSDSVLNDYSETNEQIILPTVNPEQWLPCKLVAIRCQTIQGYNDDWPLPLDLEKLVIRKFLKFLSGDDGTVNNILAKSKDKGGVRHLTDLFEYDHWSHYNQAVKDGIRLLFTCIFQPHKRPLIEGNVYKSWPDYCTQLFKNRKCYNDVPISNHTRNLLKDVMKNKKVIHENH